MTLKTILVSAINHVPDYEDPGLPHVDPHPMDIAKRNIGCSIHFGVNAPQPIFTFSVREHVAYGEDFTAAFDVPSDDPHGVEFFWEEAVAGQTFRRIAWWDRPQEDFGKAWGWAGMFWLFSSVGGLLFERTACAIAPTKFAPWPPDLRPTRGPV